MPPTFGAKKLYILCRNSLKVKLHNTDNSTKIGC